MKQYSLSIIGAFHTDHNEDSSTLVEIGETHLLMAVMDGCSMGKESHFASILITKLLRKIGKEISFRLFAERAYKETDELLKMILKQLFQELRQLKNQLYLEQEEMLSTLILGLVNVKQKNAELLTIGDGLICCNGEFTEYEQDDKPDYLGYHLTEDFEYWYVQQRQRLSLKNVMDLSLSTDGIFTFRNFDGKEYPPISEAAILHYLLIDLSWEQQKNMLNKKRIEIENKYGMSPGDDLTILRIIID